MGVFLANRVRPVQCHGLPHARGGVSQRAISGRHPLGSSPRPWGCFRQAGAAVAEVGVFPTPVGVFLFRELHTLAYRRLPHARGGVSETAPVTHGHKQVFPTPVGVFPGITYSFCEHRSLPHARGGVSNEAFDLFVYIESSPRPWGCFCFPCSPLRPSQVFPTPVGVFLWGYSNINPPHRLPHARGGVSAVTLTSWAGDASSPRPWGCFQTYAS